MVQNIVGWLVFVIGAVFSEALCYVGWQRICTHAKPQWHTLGKGVFWGVTVFNIAVCILSFIVYVVYEKGENGGLLYRVYILIGGAVVQAFIGCVVTIIVILTAGLER